MLFAIEHGEIVRARPRDIRFYNLGIEQWWLPPCIVIAGPDDETYHDYAHDGWTLRNLAILISSAKKAELLAPDALEEILGGTLEQQALDAFDPAQSSAFPLGCGEHWSCVPELCPLAHYFLRREAVVAALKYQCSRLRVHEFVRARWTTGSGLTEAHFRLYEAMVKGMLSAERWETQEGHHSFPDNLSVPRRAKTRMWAYGEALRKLEDSAHAGRNTVIAGMENCRDLGILTKASCVRLKDSQKPFVRTAEGFARDPHRKKWVSRRFPVAPPDFACIPILSPADLVFVSREAMPQGDFSGRRNAKKLQDTQARILRDEKMKRLPSPPSFYKKFEWATPEVADALSENVGAGEKYLLDKLKDAWDEGSFNSVRECLNVMEAELLGFQSRSHMPTSLSLE